MTEMLVSLHESDIKEQSPSPASSVSQLSASDLSETSSKASSQLSKSSGYTSSTTTMTTSTNFANKSRSKAPTLDAIAARMKKTNVSDKQDGPSAENTEQSGGDVKLSRLPMPGRLHSTLSESSDSSLNMMPPAPVAHGEPPKFSRGRNDLTSLRDKAANRSRSVSPTKPQVANVKTPLSGASLVGSADSTKSVSTTSTNKEMPSLQDIIDRMSKKGLSSSSSSRNVSRNASAEVARKASIDGSSAEAAEKTAVPVKPSVQVKKQESPSATEAKEAKVAATSTEEKKEAKGHPLQHKWTMYFDSKSWNPSSSTSSAPDAPGSPHASSSTTANSWEAALKMLGVYTTVEAFMSIFSTLRRPSQLERNSNYHLFKNGIKPMWEDAANQNGGKWIITLRGTNTALLDRSWMWLVLALIGEELDENDDVTGAVVSTRSKGDRIALWIRNKTDVDLVNKIGKKFVQLLDLENEPGVSLEFSPNSMDTGSNRKGLQGTPSKFISFNNPPNFSSPVFGQSPLPPTHHVNRLHSSPGKSIGGTPNNRPLPPRRGSEQSGDSALSLFPMGLGGPIGRTGSPGPNKSGTNHLHSSLGSNGSATGGLLAKPKMGLSMSPPM